MHYDYLTSNSYYFEPNTKLIKIDKTRGIIKFKQIIYTIDSISDIFNGYETLDRYHAVAIRTSNTKVKKYILDVYIDDTGNIQVDRAIYYRDIL